MLRGLRHAGQTVVGKSIATIFFVLLIASFAVWGIGDIFRTQAPTTVATVGSHIVTTEAFRQAYNNELQRLGRQFRTVITPEQARLFGIDQRVASTLVTQAVMDEQARKLGLSVPDDLVARSILQEPGFRGSDGQFNRALFEQILRSNGLTEAGFVQDQRASMVRNQLADAITGDLPVPNAARDAMHRYANERRSASYINLQPAAAGEIPAPTPEQLQAFYNDRKSSFQAPEYRAISALALDSASLAKPETVSDADARQRYDQEKAKFGSPERRTVQQITFATPADAEAAFARIKEGASFDAIAAERNVAPQDLELGTFARTEMLDPLVADAAFALPPNGVSGPVAGRFGPVLVRVTAIQPEAVKPFEEVAGEIRQEIAGQRASADIEAVHDQIEDQRASARPLAEIAKDRGLTLVQIPAIERGGLDKAGRPVEAPAREALVNAAFASDIGVDNEALRTPGGGYVWYDVTGIEPSREKALDEVRDAAARAWREDEVAKRLSDRARGLTERLDKGEPIETVALGVGDVRSAADLARRAGKDDLTAEAVNRIFAVPVGKAGNVANGNESRVVFKVTGATVPPIQTTTEAVQQIEDQLRTGMTDDLLSEYVAQLRQDLGITLNQSAIRQVTGNDL
ncbi:MAG: SurA N-terminal domain-containing protein [Microvirga sp.]